MMTGRCTSLVVNSSYLDGPPALLGELLAHGFLLGRSLLGAPRRLLGLRPVLPRQLLALRLRPEDSC